MRFGVSKGDSILRGQNYPILKILHTGRAEATARALELSAPIEVFIVIEVTVPCLLRGANSSRAQLIFGSHPPAS
jgi:hypothetical protein